MLLNAAKCQGYRLYHFWVIKGKPTEAKKLCGMGPGGDKSSWPFKNKWK